jgi:hypothetical protein
MKNIRKNVKRAVTIVVYVGVSAIVKNVVDTTTPKSTGKLEKAAISIGMLALAGVITKHALGFTEETVDKTADKVEEMANNGDLK